MGKALPKPAAHIAFSAIPYLLCPLPGGYLAKQALVYTLRPNQQALTSCWKNQQVASLRPPSLQQFLLTDGAQIESSTAKTCRVLTFPLRQPEVKQPWGVLKRGSFLFVTSYVKSHPEAGGQCPPLSWCQWAFSHRPQHWNAFNRRFPMLPSLPNK